MSLTEERLTARGEAKKMVGQKTTERFDVVRSESTLTFSAMSNVHPVHGKATDLDGFIEAVWNANGTVALDPMPRMHLGFTVDFMRTGNDMQDREMAKLIDSKRFPKIAGDLRELRPGAAPRRFVAAGDITLAGLARRYEGELSVERDGSRVALDGDVNVDVRDFGLKAMNLLVLSVAPIVKVRLRLVAVKAAARPAS